MSISDRLSEIRARIIRARADSLTDRYMVLDVDAPALVGAIRAVLDLHEPDGHDPQDSAICPPCAEYHPCPTVRAVTAALGEDS